MYQRLNFSPKTNQPISTLHPFQISISSGHRCLEHATSVFRSSFLLSHTHPFLYTFPFFYFLLNPSKLKQKFLFVILVASLLLQLNFLIIGKTIYVWLVGSALWVNLKNICSVGGKIKYFIYICIC